MIFVRNQIFCPSHESYKLQYKCPNQRAKSFYLNSSVSALACGRLCPYLDTASRPSINEGDGELGVAERLVTKINDVDLLCYLLCSFTCKFVNQFSFSYYQYVFFLKSISIDLVDLLPTIKKTTFNPP
jgi:hypothetical protein